MGTETGDIKHEEIWDDSALIDSWNEALEEYKKYHSIHARGGTVDDIPDLPESTWDAKPETLAEASASTRDVDAPPLETIVKGSDADGNKQFDSRTDPGFEGGVQDPATFAGPQALIGTVEDDELKKLLMSWYWAGYYTATYQAKQKQDQPTSDQ